MAYLHALNTVCDTRDCSSLAKQELLDWRNESRGKFCNKCAKKALLDRLEFEKGRSARDGSRIKK